MKKTTALILLLAGIFFNTNYSFSQENEATNDTFDLVGKVRDADSKESIHAQIEIEGQTSKEVISKETNYDGGYRIKLRFNETYNISISAEGYYVSTWVIDRKGLEKYESMVIPTELIKKGGSSTSGPVALAEPTSAQGGSNQQAYERPGSSEVDNIYFDHNSSYFKSSDIAKLNQVINVLNQDASSQLIINGHADCSGTDHYNNWISQRRAKRVADYISSRITNGASRVTEQSYGESHLSNNCECEIHPSCSEEENSLNRRVEFIIK